MKNLTLLLIVFSNFCFGQTSFNTITYKRGVNGIVFIIPKNTETYVVSTFNAKPDLKTEIAEGRFREDLYHRLAVILIKVPALNDRRDDIPLLIEYFNNKIASEQGNASKVFSKQAVKLLQEYDWTGNIRELRNVIERLIILGGNEISEDDVRLFASK